jgi:cob(I)alamin adenosyltransferase
VIKYLNRLSDLLFVLCRVLARQDGQSEILWDKNRRQIQQSNN